MKKKVLIFLNFVIILVSLTLFVNETNASDMKTSLGNMLEQAGQATEQSQINGAKDDVAGQLDKVNAVGATVLTLIQVLGTVLGIIMLVVTGIKFFTSGPDKKANLKQELINYVIGAILLFGCAGVAKIVYDVIQPAVGTAQINGGSGIEGPSQTGPSGVQIITGSH